MLHGHLWVNRVDDPRVYFLLEPAAIFDLDEKATAERSLRQQEMPSVNDARMGVNVSRGTEDRRETGCRLVN